MNLEEIARKEIEKMDKVIKEVKVLEPKALEIYNLAISYLIDSKYFLEKKDFIRAFECVVISWAYLDACLHLNLIEIPEKYKDYFTK
ncbi:MAG: DUF357 domain-containing protein [Candidatus Aenigmatarchaeota archaeon]